jgi:hypothetical protein
MVERRQRETHELTGAARYDAIRTTEWTYVEYGNGERELYDLIRDPYQVQNAIAKAEPGLVTALSQRLAELANCAASACRTYEDLPVMPPAEIPVAEAVPSPKTVAVKGMIELPRPDVGAKGVGGAPAAITPVAAKPALSGSASQP